MPHPVKRDLDEVAQLLSGWLAERVEGTQSVRVVDLTEPSSTGFSSETLLFAAEWETDDGTHAREEMVMRLQPSGITIFPTYDIPLQFRVMDSLRDTAVPVPRVRWLEEDPSLFGVPFYVMDRVEGRVPTDTPPYHLGGWVFEELTPERREALWWSGLEAMAEVHKLDWRALGYESLDDKKLGATPLEQQLQYYEDYFTWGCDDRSNYPATQAGLDYLHANRPEDPPVRLCWGDSRIANQIFRDEKCVAVIDWEMVHLGSPVEDLAWWLMSDACFSEAIGAERASGLPTHKETIARWEKLVGMSADEISYYEILALMRFSIHLMRIGIQMKHYEILPADATFDRDNMASQLLVRKLAEISGSAG